MKFYLYYSFLYVGRNSVVYIAAGYGLDDPGIVSSGPTQPPIRLVPDLFRG
jgi:hypothetical protein